MTIPGDAELIRLHKHLERLEAHVAALQVGKLERDRKIEQLHAGLLGAWEKIAALESEIRLLRGVVRQGSVGERVAIDQAARVLGVSGKHARRLAARGLLDAADLRTPGSPRAFITVTASSLAALLKSRGLQGRQVPENLETVPAVAKR